MLLLLLLFLLLAYQVSRLLELVQTVRSCLWILFWLTLLCWWIRLTEDTLV